jgi:8-oxo-dGTP diphosphatase
MNRGSQKEDAVPEIRFSCYALVHNARGQVLVLQRAGGHRHFAGQWEFPGGKLDTGEEVEAALCREVREESGLDVAAGALAGAVEWPMGAFRVILLFFETHAANQDVILSPEHVAWRWVDWDDVTALEITEPLRRFLETYRTRLAKMPGA